MEEDQGPNGFSNAAAATIAPDELHPIAAILHDGQLHLARP